MRLQPFVRCAAAAVAVGALAASSHGLIRLTTNLTRPLGSNNGHQITRPPKPAPRAPETFITIDRVRYRVTCTVTRTIGGIALEDGTVPVMTNVELVLRRTDGRPVNREFPQPQLVISQGGSGYSVQLSRAINVLPSGEAIFSGQGLSEWANDVQLTGRLTIGQQRGLPATTQLRSIPFTLIPLP